MNPRCAELAPLYTMRLLGVLSESEQAEVESHLATCPECPLRARALEAALDDAKPPAVEPPASLWDEIDRRLGPVSRQATVASRRRNGGRRRTSQRLRRQQPSLGLFLPLSALAAAAVVLFVLFSGGSSELDETANQQAQRPAGGASSHPPARPPRRPTAPQPPVAAPPVAAPPVADPPATAPPVADPPATAPPVADPPATDPPGERESRPPRSLTRDQPLVASVLRVQGDVFLRDADGRRHPTRGAHVKPGAELETVGERSVAVVVLSDSSHLRLSGNSRLAFAASSLSRITVSRGEVFGVVAKRSADERLTLRTPHSESIVVGTRLRLSVDAQATRLAVEEGAVEFSRRDGSESVRVSAGQFAVTGSTPLVARALSLSGVLSLTLIDADRDRSIPEFDPLQDGDVLDLSRLPTRRLNVRANVTPTGVEAVRFSDTGVSPRTEKAPPYALAGRAKRSAGRVNYRAWTPRPGWHTLRTVVRPLGAHRSAAPAEPLAVRFFVRGDSVREVARWSFDERRGGRAHDSAGKNAGVCQGNPTWRPRAGWRGGALEFDGVDDVVVVPHSRRYLLEEGTIALRFQTTARGPQGLFSKDADRMGTGGHLELGLDNGLLVMRLQEVADSHPLRVAAPRALDGRWHHAAVTFGPLGLRLYFDGRLVATDSYTGGLGRSSGGDGNFEPIVIGANSSLSGDLSAVPMNSLFHGLIDDVRIFNGSLSAAEIEELAAGR